MEGGGLFKPCGAKLKKKCSHNNNTALIKKKSILDTALVITNQVSNLDKRK